MPVDALGPGTPRHLGRPARLRHLPAHRLRQPVDAGPERVGPEPFQLQQQLAPAGELGPHLGQVVGQLRARLAARMLQHQFDGSLTPPQTVLIHLVVPP